MPSTWALTTLQLSKCLSSKVQTVTLRNHRPKSYVFFKFIFQLVTTLVGFYTLDKIGRKKSLILSFGAMCVSMVGMTAYTSVVDDTENTSNDIMVTDLMYDVMIRAREDYNSLTMNTTVSSISMVERFTNHVWGNQTNGEHYVAPYMTDGTEVGGESTSSYTWVPLVCLMANMAAVALGVNPVPYILTYEYFPTWLRPLVGNLIV